MDLVVVTWNIHKCIGGIDRRYRPERVIEVLQHYRPDIVLLQEVDDGAHRSRYEAQVEVIGDALDMRHRIFQPTHRLRSMGQYGNAILSHWPLFDERHLDLTIGTRKRRGALYAKARVRHGGHSRTLALYNLHLGLAGSERIKQLERFLESHPFQGLHQRTPIVFGGDLNDLYATLGSKLLEPAGFQRASNGSPPFTFPAWAPLRPLDAIFLRGDVRAVDCAPSRLELARSASDHRPLVAQLKLVGV
jgi:endonuclease/exonuclease/phosphatase family metal-dependent hydrolase